MSQENSLTLEELLENVDFFGHDEDSRPVIATAAPPAMRKLLLSYSKEKKMGELAIRAVNLQLQLYEENIRAVKSGVPVQGKT
ncbi:hypothetical protein FRC17_002688, partial [Serendipita sp. 399]